MAKVQAFVLVLFIVAAVKMFEADAYFFCRTSDTELNLCRPAVRKWQPTMPSRACCAVAWKADLKCLCGKMRWASWFMSDFDLNRALKVPGMCGTRLPYGCWSRKVLVWSRLDCFCIKSSKRSCKSICVVVSFLSSSFESFVLFHLHVFISIGNVLRINSW